MAYGTSLELVAQVSATRDQNMVLYLPNFALTPALVSKSQTLEQS